MEAATLARPARSLEELARARAADIPDTYPPNRLCIEPGCITLLSVYNPNEACWCHVHLYDPDTTSDPEGW